MSNNGIIESLHEAQKELLAEVKALKTLIQANLSADTAQPQPDTAEPEKKSPVKKRTTRKKAPAKKKTPVADERDWVKDAIALARKAVSESIDRSKIFEILAEKGVDTISQANQEQAKEIHEAIEKLFVKESEEF